MTIQKVVFYCLTLQLACCDDNIANLYKLATHGSYNTIGCINNILTKYFPCGTLTTFVNPNENINQLIKATNSDKICHSIIVRSFDDRNWFVWTNVYVITAQDLLTLWSGLLDLTRDVFWNPRAKFIVEVDNLKGDNVEIQEIFKTLLKHKIFNVIVLQSIEEDAVIYTYHPFHDKNCGKRFNKVISLGTCETITNNIDYFPNKVPNALQDCSVRVVATDDVPNFISPLSNYTVYGKFVSGLEQYLLETIGVREGFSIDYNVFDEDEPCGIVLPNRTTTGLLTFIDRDKADIAAGGYALMKNRVELFDYLWGFNYAAYYLYTPANGNEIWRRVYREFGTTTWLLIGAALIYVILVCQVLKKILNDNTFSILNLWGAFFGNTNIGLSRHKKFRMIIFWWTWFAYFISNFYNTALCSLTSVHVHEKPHYLSAGNLKSLPYTPCISDNSRAFFQFAYNQSLPEGEAILNCSYTHSSLEYVAKTKKYYAIEMEYSYKIKEYEYVDEHGKPELDSWIFSSTNVIVMYFVRGFPFIEKFQDYAHRMYEAGLIKNHLKTINIRSYSVLQRYPKPFTKVRFQDIKMHFLILIIGYTLSFLCLLLELWYKYMQKKIKIQRNKTVKLQRHPN